MNYFEEIKAALIDRVKNQEITRKTRFNELGLDSLDLMDLVVQLEQKIEKQIPDNKLMEIKTIGDLVDAIDQLD